MRLSIARGGEQLDPNQRTIGLHPVARELLLISHPAEGRRLSWPEHTVGSQFTAERHDIDKCTTVAILAATCIQGRGQHITFGGISPGHGEPELDTVTGRVHPRVGSGRVAGQT